MTINKRFKELIEKDDILWDYIDKRENFFNIQTSEDLLTKEKRKLCTFVEFKKKELLYRNWTKKGCLPAIKTVVAHDVDVITCLEITPEYVITAADDTFIKVYDLSGEKQTTLKGHEGGVWALKYDLETNFLITAGTDRSIRIWDLSTFKCIYVFKGHTSTVRCLELSSNEKNGKFILSGSRDSNIMVWRLPSEACQETEDELVYNVFHVNPYYLGTLKGHTDSVRSMSVYKNILVTGSYDGTCRIWNISDLRCICRMVGNGSRVYAVVYDHKRNKVYSTTTDFKIFVWEVKNYKNTGHITRYPNQPKMLVLNSPALILQGHAGLVGLLELKGDILCSAAADGSVKGWDINNFNILFQYYHNGNIPISSFWFDDNFLILGSEIQFTVVNIRNGDILFNDTLHFADNVWGIKSDGKRIYTAIVKDHKSYLSVLDFTKLEKKPPYANMYPNVLRGSLSVSKEYMFRRRLSPQRYLKDNQENSLADECDTPLSETSNNKVYHRAGSASNSTNKNVSLEEKLFGPSRLQSAELKLPNDVNSKVLLVSFALVMTSATVFILGVIVIIQYRTLPLQVNAKMVFNASIIVACIMSIFYLHTLNVKLYKYVCKNSSGVYHKILNTTVNEDIELETMK
ncbi:hypothetical protein ACO0OE_000618 [Hanseniaspora uvarum]